MTQELGAYGFAEIDREEDRRKIVILVLTILWILVLEGAVRKWFAPGLSKPLLFLKDPFVLLIYYFAARSQIFPMDSIFLRTGFFLAAIFLFLGAMHFIGLSLSPACIAYGWRQYFLVLPLAFVIGSCFTGRDLKTMIKQSMIMVAINGVLCVIQSRLPVTHPINATVAEGVIFAYGEGEGIARASGTFSFTYGHEIFTASTVPLIFALWLIPAAQRSMSLRMLAFYSICGLMNVLLDGNRGVFLFVAFNLAACVPGYWLLRDPRLKRRALMLPFIACALGAIMYATFFANSMQAMTHRIVTTEQDESSLGRLFQQFHAAMYVLGLGDILGAGLGLGSGGGQALAGASCPHEYELPRVIWETGLLGLAYLIYRWALSYKLAVGSVQASIRSSNLLPVLLVSFVLQVLPVGQMTSNATCVYYGWMFTGFTMAAIRLRGGR
ncbi:MAG: hypothetical protein K2W95_22035 [Candidatus Obscuribacterales bacterium]|nr:hypothetical protein [Candidatus Obscuribacterales bacterium]